MRKQLALWKNDAILCPVQFLIGTVTGVVAGVICCMYCCVVFLLYHVVPDMRFLCLPVTSKRWGNYSASNGCYTTHMLKC